MMDMEKVIKGWECHMEADTLGCADCPYRQGWRTCNFADTLFKDVYAMLKEQETQKFFVDESGKITPLPVVVRCKDCLYWQDNNDGYPHIGCKWREDETPDPDDFCSAGERREK